MCACRRRSNDWWCRTCLHSRRQEENLDAEDQLAYNDYDDHSGNDYDDHSGNDYDDHHKVHNDNGRPVDNNDDNNNNGETWASAFDSRSPR
jgi:hypothetical protein